jgi:hypothetical protein
VVRHHVDQCVRSIATSCKALRCAPPSRSARRTRDAVCRGCARGLDDVVPEREIRQLRDGQTLSGEHSFARQTAVSHHVRIGTANKLPPSLRMPGHRGAAVTIR